MSAVLKPLCTDKELGEVLGLSDRHVRRLTADGVFAKIGAKNAYNTVGSIQAYIEFKSANAKGSDEYEQARTRLTLAKAKKAEAETEMFQGKLVDTEAAVLLWSDRIQKLTTKALAIPVKLAGPIGAEPNIAMRQQMMETEIINALNEAAAIDQTELIAKSLEKYGQSARSATEEDTEPVE